MTRAIPAKELAPALRRAIEAETRGEAARVANRSVVNKRERTPRAPSLGWQCNACGAVHASWAAAVRHADAEGHPRIACVLKGA